MKKILRLILTVSLILTSLIMVTLPVYAATQNRTITGEGHYAQGTYTGGAANYTNMNSDDGDTTYIEGGLGMHHTWDFEDFAETNSGINSVTVYFKSKGQIDGLHSAIVSTDSSTHWHGQYLDVTSGSYYVLYSYTWTTDPSTGLAWTTSGINNKGFGVFWIFATVGGYRCTYVYLVVDYVPSSFPSVTTVAASSITSVTATLNGNITATGGATVDQRGFVYDTVSRPAPGNVAPAASGYASNWTEGGSFGTGTFLKALAGLTASTPYYFRACAHNSVGWAYGDELTFSTLGNPAITTVAATQVGGTTARLHASVTSGGGEACTVKFAYATTAGGPYANYAAIVAAGTEVTCSGTYTTGQTPYYDISNLTINTGYTFACKITNSVSSQYGSQLTFTTSTGVDPPSNFKVIPEATTMSMSWVKGSGSTTTYIRYKANSLPMTLIDGTLVYDGTSSSYQQTGLTPGTPYYYRAWGRSGSLYSSTNVTGWAVTIASASGTGEFTTPTTPSGWFAAPDHTRMSGLPIYSMVNWWGGVFSIPLGTTWFLLAMIISVILGVAVYAISAKLPAAMGVTAGIVLLFGAAGIVPIWLSFPLMLLTVAVWAIGERM